MPPMGSVLLAVSAVLLHSVETPHPGLTLVRQPGSAMVIGNLCSPGVQVRATKYGERKGTPQEWAQAVGAKAAINADFFDFPGWTLVNGRARGAGEDWPADKQYFESRSYWQFGLFNADLQQNAAVPPAGSPWTTDIVGGHNILIRDGQSLGPTFDGDAVITTAHRRTAIGLSKDRRTVFLFATDHVIDGNGMVNELRALAAEAGAPAIDIATNMDGGGSSQLYVEGFGQVITSGRQVNNHLGLFASGSGLAPNCNNIPPRGSLDAVSCDGAAGWAQDQNVDKQAIDVHVYWGGPAGSGAPGKAIRAGDSRSDLCTALGSCEHAFTMAPPLSLFDGAPHEVHAYAIDSELHGPNPELGGSPRTLTCARPPPDGVLRHVVDPAAYAAFKFDAFFDLQVLADGALAARAEWSPFPTTVQLVRETGQGKVFLVDGPQVRWVQNPESAAAWHFDLGTVKEVSKAEMAQWTEGPPLRLRPWLVRGSGPAVYVVDDAAGPSPERPFLPASPPPSMAHAVLAKLLPPGIPSGPEPDPTPMTPSDSEPMSGGCAAAPSALLLALAVLPLRRRR
ncbi:MAG: phosphodiester glycosidase family protein [Myxococcaceae bacterium]|nr:phosphodiester glycosidase family protein [Myxococcaceae bacterium]